ncbi:MAG: acylglycerol kinase family protein [Nocardioides sp.]
MPSSPARSRSSSIRHPARAVAPARGRGAAAPSRRRVRRTRPRRTHADEALDLARAQVAAGVDALVVAGGDELVHLAVQAVAGSGVPLGIIPAGSGNDVARYLDLPRSDRRGRGRRHRVADSHPRPGPW